MKAPGEEKHCRGTWWQAGPPGETGYSWLLCNFRVMSRVSLGATPPGTCTRGPSCSSRLGLGHSEDEDMGSVGDGLETPTAHRVFGTRERPREAQWAESLAGQEPGGSG